jgi:hypothetical protein
MGKKRQQQLNICEVEIDRSLFFALLYIGKVHKGKKSDDET